uniref:Zinc transporter ZIP1 n=1 Tax=Acrobeloides nanus TaxID=290746 RepID=A0A914CBW6_9BILA
MDLMILKVILVAVMIVLTLIAGAFPVRLLNLLRKRASLAETQRKKRVVSLTLCLLTCFSGGVFLATCFMHLLPELNDHLDYFQERYKYHVDYPIAELLSCCGFFLLFFLEELVLFVVPSAAHGHSHGRKHSHHEENNHHGTLPRLQTVLYGNGTTLDRENHTCNLLLQDQEIEAETPVHPNTYAIKAVENGVNHSGTIKNNVADHICPNHKDTEYVVLAEPERCERNCETIDEHPPILMKSQPHAHSHGVRSITFVLAISFHSIVEGLALGVQNDAAKVSAIFLSLMVHKLIVAFSVGLQLARTHAHALHWVCASVLLFSLMTPLGALIGMFVQSSLLNDYLRDLLILVFQGLAVGTFLYVTFFEVLIHERDNEHPNLLKLLMMIIGFTLIGLLRLITEGHSHGAGDEHAHDHHIHPSNHTGHIHVD